MVFGKKSSSDDTQPSQWKKKYYDALDDLEYKEEQWHQVEKLLRNAIVRISLAVSPRHKLLNKLLNNLRDDIRNGKDSLNLRVQFDKIIAVIRDLDSEEDESTQQYSAKKLVEECIDRVQWSEKAQQFRRGLARQFNNIQDDEVQKFIHSFTKLINQEFIWYEEELKEKRRQEDALAQQASSSEKTKQPGEPAAKPEPAGEMSVDYPVVLITLLKKMPVGLFDEERLRSLQLKAATSKTRQQAIETIELIAQSCNKQATQPQQTNETFSSEAAKVLIEFLELVSLPDDLSVQAETIRQELIDDSDNIKNCLNKTVELVMTLQQAFKDERKELETFLSELSTRLQEIDNEVKVISGISDKRSENANNINTSLSETADSIDAFLNNETSLDALKDSVKSHVIMIRHHMDTFLAEDKTQKKYSDEAVQQLAKELITVKREAESLREQLEKKRLQATHDTLTRIPNRLAYDEWITQEYERFVKYDTPFVLMVWDVDFFKRVNDEYGHQAGDKVLRVVAQMLSENIRDADFVARYGGEEFVVVLPGTQQQAAMRVGENIRKAIEGCAFHFRDKPVKVTASAGIAEIQSNETVEQLFERADKALYKAKNSGRNNCMPA